MVEDWESTQGRIVSADSALLFPGHLYLADAGVWILAIRCINLWADPAWLQLCFDEYFHLHSEAWLLEEEIS